MTALPASILTLAITTSAAFAADPWDLIENIEVTEIEKNGEWRVEKAVPDALRAMATDFTITGYYVPVEAQGYVKSFLLVPDPADCPFCGESGYGTALEVHMRRAVPDMAEATEVTVSGRLEFNDSPETYQTVVLQNARLKN